MTTPAPELTDERINDWIDTHADYAIAVGPTIMGRQKLIDFARAVIAADRASAAQADDTRAFKNFHRALCARFGYVHDEIDWRRDQVSLEEHIAKQVAAQAEPLSDERIDFIAETLIKSMPDGILGFTKSWGWRQFAREVLDVCGVRAPSAAEKRDAWQPIATAPKDGRTLLLGRFNRNGLWRTSRGEWISREAIDESFEDPELAEPGWFETVVESDEPPNCWPFEPTHWQPLPAPPAAIAQGERS